MSEQHPESSGVPATARAGAASPLRSHAVWLLAVASLLPGVVAVTARDFFHGLPYAFRLTLYVLSGLMMAAVVVLILTQKERA